MVTSPAKEEGPAYKDQVRSHPDEAEEQNPPIPSLRAGEQNGIGARASPVKANVPNFKDQVQSGAVRIAYPNFQHGGSQDGRSGDEESSGADFSAPRSQNDVDPSLINAVLVDSNAIPRAEEVSVEKKWKKVLILAVAMAVVLAVGVAAGVYSKSDGGDEDTRAPTVTIDPPTPPPSPQESSFSTPPLDQASSNRCSIDFNVVCTVPETNEFCRLYVPEFESQTCMYRPIAATMLYNGGSCEQSLNMETLNFTCQDSFGGPPFDDGQESYIVVTDNDGAGPVLFEGIVAVGELFGLSNNETQFGDVQQITISTSDQRSILQVVNCSLTCSHPLEFLNLFGASQVLEYINNEQGLITPFGPTFDTQVDIQLLVTAVITNQNETMVLSNVTASEESFGTADLSSSLSDNDQVDSQNAVEFVLEATVDPLTQTSYTIDFSYEGISTIGNETTACDGVVSTVVVVRVEST